MSSNRLATAQRGLRKSPLRLAADPMPAISPQPPWPPDGVLRADCSPREMRQMMISEFGEWLRSRTNKYKRPFQEETISAYRDAAVALDSWITQTGLESDFAGCDTATLNRFFGWYYGSHGQGGTNTKQRNLRHLFTWLEAEYDHLHPYTDNLVRYASAKTRSATLAAEFIKDRRASSFLAPFHKRMMLGLRALPGPYDCSTGDPAWSAHGRASVHRIPRTMSVLVATRVRFRERGSARRLFSFMSSRLGILWFGDPSSPDENAAIRPAMNAGQAGSRPQESMGGNTHWLAQRNADTGLP